MTNGTTQHTPADVRGRIIRASILPIEDAETMIARLRAGAEAVERGELDAEDFAGTWSQYLRELFRRASSVPTPADVRERVAREVFTLDADWRREYWDQFRRDFPRQAQAYYDTADRILALFRSTRGEGEMTFMDEGFSEDAMEVTQYTSADVRERVVDEIIVTVRTLCPGAAGSVATAAYAAADRILALLRSPRGEEKAWPGDAENDASFLRSWARYLRTEAQDIREAQDRADWKQQAEYTEVAAARMDQIANRIAALRSEAHVDGEADHLIDLIRWAESHHTALEPVVGNIMPPGTYACYVGDDDDPYMGPGILGAIRAARRGEGGGK